MRKIIPVVAAGATALALAGGTFAYTTVQKDVVLSVDGASRDVTVMSSTVGDVLAAEGIVVGSRDVVAPAVDASVTDGTRIAVQYGRQVKVTVDGKQQSFWTTATDVGGALTALGIDSAGGDLSTSRSAGIGREGLSFDLATMKTVTIRTGATKRTVRTTAQTVAGALQAAKLSLDSDDLMSVKKTAPLTDGASFTVTRVEVRTVTEKKKIGYDTVRQNTSWLDRGDTRVDTAGKRGTRTLTYSEVRHDGKLVTRKKTGSTITKKAVDKVILVGTKVEKKVEKKVAKVTDTGDSSSKKSGTTSTGSGVWDKIAQCESGGNWAINTGNGFYGGLQFTLSTWRAYGGSGMPNNASRSTQISVAKRVQAAQGWGAWPACTSKLGLR